MSEHDGQDLRELAFAWSRGELDERERARVERALAQDDELARHYARISESLELARGEEPERTRGDADASWAAIAERLGLDEDEDEPAPRRWLAAAAIVVALGAGALVATGSGPEATAETPIAVLETTDAAPAPVALRAHRVAGLEDPLFVSDGAEWSYDAGGLALERGRVLVEFVPQSADDGFRVRAGDVHVEVLGTVFSVERDGDEVDVTVYEGLVRVDHDARSRTLGTGESMRVSDWQPRLVSEAQTREVSRSVDLEAHRVRLATVHTARGAQSVVADVLGAATEVSHAIEGASSERAVSAPQAPRGPSVEERMRRAERWMARGEYARAKRELESLRRVVSKRSARARSIELDLARIATHHIRDPERAKAHLRRVVKRWPSHPAARLARQQLCALGACEEAP